MDFNLEAKHSDTAHHMVLSPEVIATIDNNSEIHYFDTVDLTVEQGDPQSFDSAVTYKYTKANSSSTDGKYLCLYLDTKKKTFLCTMDRTTRRFKPRVALSWSGGVTEVSEFSHDNSMVAVGGADGHLMLYSTKNGRAVQSLPKESEYITCIAFSANSKMVAYASFKKRLIIFDLVKNMPIKITSYDHIIGTIGFLHKTNFLIYGARDNSIILFDILNGRTIRELGNTINWPMSIYVDRNDQYALISDKAGYVYIVDLTADEADLEPFYNSDSIVLEIKPLGNDYLYFLFEDGTIKVVNVKEEIERVLEDAAGGSIAEIYKAISKNPILRFSVKDILAKNDELYLKRLDLAMEELAKGNDDTARKMMGKSIESPVNKEKFEAMIQHKDKVINFWHMISNGEYAMAYDQANSGDFYKRLPFYDKMERRYGQVFNSARDILIQSNDLRSAQSELGAFMKIPVKRKGIKSMFDSPELFLKAEKRFVESDYNGLNSMIENHPELIEAPFYQDYKAVIDDSVREFVSAMSSGSYTRAMGQKEFIEENFPEAARTLKDDFKRLEVVEKFNAAVKEKKFSVAMELAAENTFLIAADEYQILDEMVSSRVEMAIKYAFAKKFVPMDKLLRPFLKSKYSRNRAIGIYKMFYIEQIEELSAKMKERHWRHAIESYVVRFGVDQEIDRLVKRHDKDKILEEFAEVEGSSFFKYKAVGNIVTGPIVPSSVKVA